MNSGAYGLFNLDGAPVDSAGIAGSFENRSLSVVSGTGFAHDGAHPTAAQTEIRDGNLFLFAGYLDEAAEAAQALGLAADTPTSVLMQAALRRWGDTTPSHLVGEWSCAMWHSETRTLTLIVSEAVRDPLFYALKGSRVAISPHIHWLKEQDWVDGDIDMEGFLFSVSRARARRGIEDRALIKGARAVMNGTVVTIRHGQCVKGSRTEPAQPPRFQGSFEEAMGEADALLRRIMRQRLARQGNLVFLLSGGLDSSLLTMIGAQERSSGQKLIALTSAAPPESGLTDESGYAQIVADHLGVPMERVAPPPIPNIYQPSVREFEQANVPLMSPRHYLYEAFYDRTVAHGASSLFDGAFGEYNFTCDFGFPQPTHPVRAVLRNLRKLTTSKPPADRWPDDVFHVRLSEQMLINVPITLKKPWDEPQNFSLLRPRQEIWGYPPGSEKNLVSHSDALSGKVRSEVVFRDQRIRRLFASFPSGFSEHEGFARAPVRVLMNGHLPESIRLRKTKMAFSPDYAQRLRLQAPETIHHIAAYRAAGVDQWLDLDWLSITLAGRDQKDTYSVADNFKVQMTASVAAYLHWWISIHS